MTESKHQTDKAQDDPYDWKTPPAAEIIRRTLSGGLKKRVCRSTKFIKHENCEEVRKSPSFDKPREETPFSREDSAGRSAGARTSSNLALQSGADFPETGSNTINLGSKCFISQPSGATTGASSKSEQRLNSSQTAGLSVPSEEIFHNTPPKSKARSESFVGAVPRIDGCEQRPKTTRFSTRQNSIKTYCHPTELEPRDTQSSQFSAGNGSAYSLGRDQPESARDDKGLSPDRPSQTSGPEPSDSSDEYDTDLELETTSEFPARQHKDVELQQDADVGHVTYKKLCLANGVLPRTRVIKQLWEKKLDLSYGLLTSTEVKIIALALTKNNHVESIDVSNNLLNAEAVSCLINALLPNIFITELNLAGSKLDITGAGACVEMLTRSNNLLALNLSGCSIGDKEAGYLAQGLQVNHALQRLNLSGNKIGLFGALQIGRVFSENTGLIWVDLSWNHIRGGGAVSIGNSLKASEILLKLFQAIFFSERNKRLEDFDISWNGLGFEGSLAFGEMLRVNKMLKKLNLENNRLNWDSAPCLARGLAVNNTLQVLQLGQNAISIHGCEEILTAVARPTSNIKFLSFKDIPINAKIALKASDIANDRDFTLQHGGVLSTKHVAGIQQMCREDPLSLLIRYLSVMGIRVVDLFRMFNKDSGLFVTKEKFVEGLKKVRVPLDDAGLQLVVKHMRTNKRGEISYQELANTVRSHIREGIQENRRQELLELKKRDERRRILQSDKSLINGNSFTGLYSMYGHKKRSRDSNTVSPVFGSSSRRDSSLTRLPSLQNGRNFLTSGAREISQTLPQKNAASSSRGSSSFSHHLNTREEVEQGYDRGPTTEGQDSRSSYVSQMKRQQISDMMRRRRLM